MKTPYVGTTPRPTQSSPRQAGNVTKSIRQASGPARQNTAKLGNEPEHPAQLRPQGTGNQAGGDTGREIDKPHRIVAKIIPGPLPEGCRVKVVETEGEVVFLHECTDYRARQIRAGAINAGLVRKGSTLAQALGGRLRHALKMRTAKA